MRNTKQSAAPLPPNGTLRRRYEVAIRIDGQWFYPWAPQYRENAGRLADPFTTARITTQLSDGRRLVLP